MPVKSYIGGSEHAIKHLLYARFIHKFLFDLGLVTCEEPFENLITQGLVKGKSYRLKNPISGVNYLTRGEAAKYKDEEIITQIEKMSKSKKNGLSPKEVIEENGVDCVKLAMVFAGPIEKDIILDEKLLSSMSGFLDRVDKFFSEIKLEGLVKDSRIDLGKLYREYEVGFNQKRLSLHVSVARLQEMFSLMKKEHENLSIKDIKIFLALLYPFASTLTAELYSKIFNQEIMNLILKETDIPPIKESNSYKLMINSKYKESISDNLINENLEEYLMREYNDDKRFKKIIVNHQRKVVNAIL